jgi:hypothetical protein
MRLPHALPLLASCALLLPLSSPALTHLARDRQALLPVVIHADSSPAARSAAEDLVAHLDQITGASFSIETATATPSSGIVLGTLDHFPIEGLFPSPPPDALPHGSETFAIRSEDGRLLLIGLGDLGASHAAYALLEHLGCRWFFPSDAWQIVPHQPTLSTTVDKLAAPALLSRRIWYGHGFFDDKARADYDRWARRNRMAASLTVRAGHAYQTIIAENQGLFATRPELLALVDGTRTGPQLCLSDPDTQDLVTRFALDRFARAPHEDMVSVDPSDGAAHCECEPCLALGTVSDRVFGMANIVARAVAARHPGKYVGLYAYNQHSEPPAFDLEPNVYIQLTAGFITGRYSFDELVELWPQRTSTMGFYEYFSVYLWDWDKLPGGRAADPADLQRRILRYVAAGASSLDAESGNNWGLHGRGYYTANRLMWDPHADLDSLLDDFYTRAFGPAAAPMRAYYERLDPANDPLLSEHLLALAFRDIEQAWHLAADHPDVLARVEELVHYLHFVHLRWIFDRSQDESVRRQAALDILTHCHRSRYAYMNHWQAIRSWQAGRWAEEFAEPSWSASHTATPIPWAVDQPYSTADSFRMLRSALATFSPDEVEQLAFSADLVPPDFGPEPGPATNQAYQGGLRYALYSIDGRPLTIDVTAGTIAHYRDRAEARYTFFDAANTPLLEGTLPLDGEPHPLTISPQAPGLIYFEIADSAAGWRIQAAPGTIATIPLQRAQGFRHAGHMQGGICFYVPRGTTELTYYWSGAPHQVIAPDGTLAKDVKASDRFIRVPIPPGSDGQIWRMSQIQLGHLWFFNIPNYVAASPAALLLPREIVEADALPTRHP